MRTKRTAQKEIESAHRSRFRTCALVMRAMLPWCLFWVACRPLLGLRWPPFDWSGPFDMPETNDSDVQGGGHDAVAEVARGVGRLYGPDASLRRRGRRMGWGRKTTHRRRVSVRLG